MVVEVVAALVGTSHHIHIRSTAQESHWCQQHSRPSQKTQRQGRLVVRMRPAMYHESSRTQPNFGREKQDLKSMAVPQNKEMLFCFHVL